MIVLTVQSFNGAPRQGASATFDERGGTIGRQETNLLVLPDPDQLVSRVHARLEYRGGTFVLIDQGGNPLLLNGQPLGAEREGALSDGDSIQIGGFVIAVSYVHPARAPAETPFRDIWGEPAPAPANARVAGRPAASQSAPISPIPDDWNPFAESVARHTPQASLEPPSAPVGRAPDLPRGGSVRDLFGIDAGTGADLQTLGGSSGTRDRAIPAPVSDHASELNMPFRSPAHMPADVNYSWQDSESFPEPPSAAAQRGLAAPVMSPPEAAQPVLEQQFSAVQPAAASASAQTSAAASPAHAPVTPPGQAARAPAACVGGDVSGLMQALLEGLGISDASAVQLDADRARTLGVLLREATQGTVQLLQARAAFKRELRAQVTTIAARENNPLKFSPDGDSALRQLLDHQSPGFLEPQQAMRDAYDDLRAHQIALMAGMRAALDGLLERFSPPALESRIAPRSGLAALLPSTRKAYLWEQFAAVYGKISQEASDDFYDVFGRSFVQAYEAEVRRLRSNA